MKKQAAITCLILFFIISNAGRLAAQTDLVLQKRALTVNIVAATTMPVKKMYDEDAKSWYAIYITGDVIHVYLAVTDPLQQRKIITNGMELWIDTKGKKNKKTGIFFPFNKHEANEKPIQGPPPGFN